jgi:hypothetical protein
MRKHFPTPVCTCCDRIARDIPAVTLAAHFMNLSPEDFVRIHDNSYDEATGEFLCDGCFAIQAQDVVLTTYA